MSTHPTEAATSRSIAVCPWSMTGSFLCPFAKKQQTHRPDDSSLTGPAPVIGSAACQRTPRGGCWKYKSSGRHTPLRWPSARSRRAPELVRNLGDNNATILRHHGLLTTGCTVATPSTRAGLPPADRRDAGARRHEIDDQFCYGDENAERVARLMAELRERHLSCGPRQTRGGNTGAGGSLHARRHRAGRAPVLCNLRCRRPAQRCGQRIVQVTHTVGLAQDGKPLVPGGLRLVAVTGGEHDRQ